jgi:YVTN family beta-propeller protein
MNLRRSAGARRGVVTVVAATIHAIIVGTAPADAQTTHILNEGSAAAPVGNSPTSVAVSPDGSKVYVSAGSTVTVIDTATNTVIATVPVKNMWILFLIVVSITDGGSTHSSVTVERFETEKACQDAATALRGRGDTTQRYGIGHYRIDTKCVAKQ